MARPVSHFSKEVAVMHLSRFRLIATVLCSLLTAGSALAHVPYLELLDNSEHRPFQVPRGIEQSIAVYAWSKPTHEGAGPDVDVYTFTIDQPTNVYLEVLVPECVEYQTYRPGFALVGPGLPSAPNDLPFAVPLGLGAIVMEDTGPRETFFEPFGDKSYFSGPVFSQILSTPGQYYVYYWDPGEQTGDYVAVLGDQEIWPLPDIIRALIVTRLIRQGKELHWECTLPAS
jgi:hypothetical protein